jgi:hypothetical protein
LADRWHVDIRGDDTDAAAAPATTHATRRHPGDLFGARIGAINDGGKVHAQAVAFAGAFALLISFAGPVSAGPPERFEDSFFNTIFPDEENQLVAFWEHHPGRLLCLGGRRIRR